jgi:hypothetical protein
MVIIFRDMGSNYYITKCPTTSSGAAYVCTVNMVYAIYIRVAYGQIYVIRFILFACYHIVYGQICGWRQPLPRVLLDTVLHQCALRELWIDVPHSYFLVAAQIKKYDDHSYSQVP